MPEIARDGNVAQAAIFGNGVLHRNGQRVRGFVKKNLESGQSFIARIAAGYCDVRGVERGVCAEGPGVNHHVHSNGLALPRFFINDGKFLRQRQADVADERRVAINPVAVLAIVVAPPARSIDRGRAFESGDHVCL